jgi:hypothetical protein
MIVRTISVKSAMFLLAARVRPLAVLATAESFTAWLVMIKFLMMPAKSRMARFLAAADSIN